MLCKENCGRSSWEMIYLAIFSILYEHIIQYFLHFFQFLKHCDFWLVVEDVINLIPKSVQCRRTTRQTEATSCCSILKKTWFVHNLCAIVKLFKSRMKAQVFYATWVISNTFVTLSFIIFWRAFYFDRKFPISKEWIGR